MESQTESAKKFSAIFHALATALRPLSDIWGRDQQTFPDIDQSLEYFFTSANEPTDVSNIGLPSIAEEILTAIGELIPTLLERDETLIKVPELVQYLKSVHDGIRENNHERTWRAINGLLNWWQRTFSNYTLPYLEVNNIYGELEKKESSLNLGRKLVPKSTAKEKCYWLIKLDYRSWDKHFKEGVTHIDYTVYENWIKRKKRPGHRLFGELHIGELVIGYGFGDNEGIMCLLKVTKEVHEHPDHGDIVSLDLINRITPIIPLAAFNGKFSFTKEFVSVRNKRLFKLSKEIYDELLLPLPRSATGKLVGLSNDYIGQSLPDDSLRFGDDVASIAAVIAYEKVIPPLAVALFGNWGSGKSFFMKMLQKEINNLSKTPSTNYCKTIIHVEFNSWHYSDANLWASLSATIFEALDKHLGENENQPNGDRVISLDELFGALDSTTAYKQTMQKELDQARIESNELQRKKNELEAKIHDDSTALKNISFKKVLTTLLDNDEVKAGFEDMVSETGIPELKNQKEIEGAKKSLEDDTRRLKNFVSMVYAVKNPAFWLALIIVILIVYFGGYFIGGSFTWLSDPRKAITGGIITIIGPIIVRYRKVNASFRKADDWIRHQYERLKIEAAAQYGTQRQQTQDRIDRYRQKTELLEKTLSELNAREEQLKKDISSKITGKRLGEFIKGRATDERYTTSLGMISWIRRDFEQLDAFLSEMRLEAKIFEDKKQNDQLSEAGQQPSKIIDRIILYIDDLDRCRENVVIRVLEAIHLLLAFPLFVVVVGVDPRWMHKSLNSCYRTLLGDTGEGPYEATSYDYLEKIFQIPFAIAEPDDSSRKALIRQQLSEDAEISDMQEVIKSNKPFDEIPSANAGEVEVVLDASATTTANPSVESPLLETKPEVRPVIAAASTKKIEEQETRLKLSSEELDFMQALSFLIGNSPRTIKRYINIYRIVRAHNNFVFKGETINDDFFAAMLLIGVLTGQSEDGAAFFQAVAAAPSIKNKKAEFIFDDFLTDYMKDSAAARPPAFHHLRRVMNVDPQLKKLSTVSMSVFKKNIVLISRFSFRPLLIDQPFFA